MSQSALQVPTSGIPGLTLLADINNLAGALASLQSGPTAPTTASTALASLAGMVWHDTTANVLKVRDQADSAWILIGSFDEVNKLFRAAATAQPVTAIAANQAITAANHGANLVATAALTLTLPQASSLANGACAFAVLAEGGAVTLTPNAADSIVIGSTAQAAAASYVLAQGSSALVVGDGAGKWYLLYLAQQSSAGSVPVRQTALSGVTDANGRAAFVTTGSGLRPGLLASASPLVLAFAHGFGANGAVDYVEEITADNAAFFPALPANATSYLYADRNGAGNVVGGSTLAPVQYGQAYNQAGQASLSLNNSIVDDFGNVWVNNGVTFANTNPAIAGTYYGVFNGSSSYIKSTSFSTLGNSGWSLRTFFKQTSLASAGVLAAVGSSGYGCEIQTNSSGKALLYLSSNGSGWDIANGLVSSATLVAGTWYFIEATYDPQAGKYFVYIGVNGGAASADPSLTVTSAAKICPLAVLSVGCGWSNGLTPGNFLSGNAQGFECLPYCQHPGGVSYSVPTALPDVTAAGYASDWFDTSAMQMKRVSAPSTVAGANPAFTVVDRVYLGEAVTGASAVSSAVSYAYQARYDSGLFAVSVGTAYTKNHNIGCPGADVQVYFSPDISGAAERPAFQFYFNGSGTQGVEVNAATRLSAGIYTGTSYVDSSAVTSGYMRIRARRIF